MLSLFKKKKKEPARSIICFETFQRLDAYLYENGGFECRAKGMKDVVAVDFFSAPSSFTDTRIKQQLKKNNFSNSIELLNTFYKKVDIEPIDPANYRDDAEFYYTQIVFNSSPPDTLKQSFKSIPQTFFITLYCTPGSDKSDDFKMMHVNTFFADYVRSFAKATAFDSENPKNETEVHAKKNLENVLFVIFEYTGLPLPDGIAFSEEASMLVKAPVLKDYEQLLELLSNGRLTKNELKAQAQQLKDLNKAEDPGFEAYDILFSLTEMPGLEDFFWHSDWKFDPEDATHFISKMLGVEFGFDYPPNTYSSDLFPYINKALAQKGRELASIDTQGDNYLFFLVNKKDKESLLTLCEKTGIDIETF